jgi:hypothetical protein
MPTYDEYEEIENSEFDPETEPTEMECNECGWRGCPSSCITTQAGATREELHCPRCGEYTNAREWTRIYGDVSDPFPESLEAAESIGPFEPPFVTRIAPAAEGPQQGGLFEEVA